MDIRSKMLLHNQFSPHCISCDIYIKSINMEVLTLTKPFSLSAEISLKVLVNVYHQIGSTEDRGNTVLKTNGL